MLFTLSDATSFVNQFVLVGGTCATATVVKDRVNEAQRRLLAKADWTQTTRRMKIVTYNNVVTLPRECESARFVDFCHTPRRIFGEAYTFIEPGPGDEGCLTSTPGQDLEDMGDGFPTFFEIPVQAAPFSTTAEYHLFAVSPTANTGGLTLAIRGFTTGGHEVLTNGVPGESLAYTTWAGGVEGALDSHPAPLTTHNYTQITSVHLPTGRTDYVSLYAVDPVTWQMYFLAKYHPDETVPGYRRYKIKNYPSYDPDTNPDSNVCAQMMCKLRYVPATRDDDVLLIQNLDAIKTMVMAIRAENAEQFDNSILLEQKAIGLLNQQHANVLGGQEPIINIVDSFGLGSMGRIH